MGSESSTAGSGSEELSPEARIAIVESEIAHALIATDFDGTLAPILADPNAVEPIPGARETLERLADSAAEVAIISGRPVSFLSRFFPSGVTIVGLYGLESWRDGELAYHSNSGVWRETMADVATAARLQGPEGMLVELKGLSITLHYRQHPELADAVEEYSKVAAESAGLRRRPARMSYELHPPIDEDKRTVLLRLAAAHSGPVTYVGDDVGDLPAFTALDELAEQGRTVLRAAVASDEMPEELRERADVLVTGQGSALELLQRLGSVKLSGPK
ncbi:MAG TPA: trehalose-phosphatase [Microthrixaceae bacterium]|nr:trehalose-phosphatase [Microthrixaceae bacterium]